MCIIRSQIIETMQILVDNWDISTFFTTGYYQIMKTI